MNTKCNHFAVMFALSTGLLVAACKPAETPDQQGEHATTPAAPVPANAEALALASAAAPPQVVELNASFIDELYELESLGLLTFNNSERDAGREYFIRLTPQGESAGLTVVHWELAEQEKAFGPFGVKGKLCDRVFHQVTGILPIEGGPKPAARVTYQMRNEPAALYPLLQSLPERAASDGFAVSVRGTLGWCDGAERYDSEFVVVQRDTGWQVNHKPVAAEPGPSMLTEREYDDAGLMIGAVSTLTIPGPVSDPDGDLVTVKGWGNFRVYNGKTEQIEPTDTVEVDGLTARFRHGVRMGSPEWFSAEYAVSDPWEETVFEFCIEDADVRC